MKTLDFDRKSVAKKHTQSSFLILLISDSARLSRVLGLEPILLDPEKLFLSDSFENSQNSESDKF